MAQPCAAPGAHTFALKGTQPADKPKIRPASRAVHDMCRFRVKAPARSHGPFDDCILLGTIPAGQAFRPVCADGCKLVQP